MSAETLTWRLGLEDKTSGPARRVAAALRQVEAQQRRVQRADDARARQAEQTARRVAAANAQAYRRAQADRARQAAAQQRSAQRVARLNAQAFRRDEAMRTRGRRLDELSGRIAERINRQRVIGNDGVRGGLALLGGVGLAAGAAVASLAVQFGGLVTQIARSVVEIAAFRESSLTALRVVLGSSEAAGRSFRNAMRIANETPLDTADVIRQQQALAVAGFNERELTPLLAASADLGAAFGDRSAEGFSYAIAQIRAAGRLQGQELLQLQNANVSRSAILDSIARQMNLRGSTPEALRRAAQQAISQRRVSDAVGIQAALDAVRTRLAGGGQLGAFAQAQSRTIGGALSNLRNAGFNLIASIDFERIPAVQKLKDLLVGLTGALDASTAAGRRSRALIEGGLSATVNLIRGVVTFGRAALPVVLPIVRALGGGFLQGLRIGFTPLLAVFRALAGGGGPSQQTIQVLSFLARGLATSLGLAAAAVTTLGLAFGTLVGIPVAILGAITGAIGNAIPVVTSAFSRIGTAIAEGIAAGIRAAAGAPRAALSALVSTLPGVAAARLLIQSPSRVFRDQIGAQIPAGLALGVEAGAPRARGAIDQLVAPPRYEPGSLRGGTTNSVVVHVQVTAGRDAAETSTGIGDALRRELTLVFNELAEAGA